MSDICFIELTKGEVSCIDKSEYERVSKFNWTMTRNGKTKYAMRKDKGKTVYLHNFLYGHQKKDKNEIIDHIDRNGLNNTRENLRITNRRLNSLNTDQKGYYFDNTDKRYKTCLSVNGSFVGNRSFINETDAIEFVSEFRKKLLSKVGSRKISTPPGEI